MTFSPRKYLSYSKSWLALFGSFAFCCTTVLEEERGQQAGEKERDNTAIVDVIIISKWKSNEYPSTSMFIEKWAARILEWNNVELYLSILKSNDSY